MPVKTIKDVDEKTWQELKTLSVRSGVKMGKMLEKLVREYKAYTEQRWKEILSGKKLLSDKEAEDMMKVVREARKEKGFRE